MILWSFVFFSACNFTSILIDPDIMTMACIGGKTYRICRIIAKCLALTGFIGLMAIAILTHHV